MDSIENICLGNLSSGVADELFQREFEKVLENIGDVNTSPTTARTITLKVVIKPNSDRTNGEITVKVNSILCPVKEHKDPIYFSKQGGKCLAFQAKAPIAGTLFDNVKDIKKEINSK